MSDVLVVWMDGLLCGRVEQRLGGALVFEYDEGYKKTAGATPLSLSMPLSRIGVHGNSVVRPFLANLLPDNADAGGSRPGAALMSGGVTVWS